MKINKEKKEFTSKKERNVLYRQLPNQTIQMVHPSTVSMKNLIGQTAIESYFNASFNPKERSVEDNFNNHYYKTTCFYCYDKGYITVPMDTPQGGYDFSYQCVCGKPELSGTSSIFDLTKPNLYTLNCVIGGEDGESCHFTMKKEKCHRFKCPKYD